jgi:hypothetical protein
MFEQAGLVAGGLWCLRQRVALERVAGLRYEPDARVVRPRLTTRSVRVQPGSAGMTWRTRTWRR